jgi:hypothetical protein
MNMDSTDNAQGLHGEAPAAWTKDDYRWAAPREELGRLMEEARDAYYQDLEESGTAGQIRRSVATYYGADPESGGSSSYVRLGGANGQKVLVNINHYQSIANQVNVLVTANRPAIQAQADTSSHGPTEDVIVATQVLEHDLAHKNLEDILVRLNGRAFMMGEAAVLQTWNPLAGKLLGPGPDGLPLYEGDIETVPLSAFDLVRDTSKALDESHDMEWCIVRREGSRHELLALVKELARREKIAPEQLADYREAILSLPSVGAGLEEGVSANAYVRRRWEGAQKSDRVRYWQLFVRKSCILPRGRYALMVTPDCVPYAGDLPYETLPVEILTPDYEEDSPWGTTPLFHLLSPQTLFNAAISIVASNFENWGDQAMWVKPSGEGAVPRDVNGQEFYESEHKPEPIDRLAIGGEQFTYLELLEGILEKLSAIGSLSRGEAAPGSSGAKNALLDAIAMRTYSMSQKAWAGALNRIYNSRLNVYKRHATTERLIFVVGEDDASAVKHFKGDALKGVARVMIKLGDPAASSVEGRKELAKFEAEQGWLTTSTEFHQVLMTGRSDALMQRDRNDARLIKTTIDRLRKTAAKLPQAPPRGTMVPGPPMPDPATGMPMPGPEVDAFDQWQQQAVPPKGGVPVALVARHLLAIRELSGYLNSPEALEDDRFAACMLSHINARIDARVELVQTMPWVAEAIGEPLTPSEQMAAQAPPPPPPGDPTAMPPPGGAPPMDGPAPEVARAEVPGGEAVPGAMPVMPRDPRSGEQVDVMGGAGGGIQ